MPINIRVTGVLINNNKILLLKQETDTKRKWSLPGGKVEVGELLEKALIREMKEETGLDVDIGDLLYVCDNIMLDKHVLHITFLCTEKDGKLGATEGLDTRKIESVEYVEISKLVEMGFSEKFVSLVKDNFSNRGKYMGAKVNIGL
jgi:mutator protein MutT